MTNITAFLLALTLTGAPVASVVCVAQCQLRPATSGDCHAGMATSEGPMISGSDSCNEPSITESPFVIEHRAMTGAAVLTTTSSRMTPALVRTDVPVLRVSRADAWRKPPLIRRI